MLEYSLMRFDILSVTPQALESYFDTSVLGRAKERGLISVQIHNVRNWAKGTYRQVDDRPYGGGAGMVLMAEPIIRVIEHVRSKDKPAEVRTKIIVLSAKGKPFNQKMAHGWAKKYQRLVLISGRYEGIDERVLKILHAEEISIGPYVLTDGDAAAMVIISAIARLVPGVIRLDSLKEESHWNLLLKKEKAASLKQGLEYPHYTRPEVLEYKGKKYAVPKILLSGNHKKIADWREKHSP
ncbi:MAG: tRNA (guanosine(37)-N1)-methyltransferase TrmD [Candidatus Sungbacteria bacterium]|uniref:tRNA (guanine-N(1)-)-methyltransferase n=1 Tax=Candidatus Sungiibacteriota bacterium TaxID=2750080 RepID=A0A9D6LTQ3_9BACT|nr:tRNA (guanosine(37)-N1)-methyltransferase TrmD [Candidatus Sungbacteria bacterium]